MGLGTGAARGAPLRGLCGKGVRCPSSPGAPRAQVRRDTEISPEFPSREFVCLILQPPLPGSGSCPRCREDCEAAVEKTALDVYVFILNERKAVVDKEEERC